MLTRAQDYGYHAPIEAGIHGTPLPVRSGAAKSVIEYEDVVYLAEMQAERRDWQDGFPQAPEVMRANPIAYSGYVNLIDTNSLVLTMADLRKIQAAAEILGPTEWVLNGNGERLYYRGNVTVEDWQDGVSTSTPIVGENAYYNWENGRAPSDCPPSNIGRVDLLAQYMSLYSYLNSIRRYMFRHEGVIKDSQLANYLPNPRMWLTQVGWPKLINTDYDGSGGYYLNEVVRPWYMVERYKRTNNQGYSTFRQSCGAETGDVYKLYIHKKWAKNRLNPAILNIQQATLYLRFNGLAQVYEYSGEGVASTLIHESASIPVVVKIGTPGSPSVSNNDDYPVYYELAANLIMIPLTQIAYPAFVAWASANVPDFDINSSSHRCIATVTFESIYLDTGVITHNAIAPAANA